MPFVKNQESQLFDLGFEEEALQKDLSPSPAHPFLFLAGMGGAGYSCPATGGEDCSSAGCWRGMGGFPHIGEPGSQHISWCAPEGGKQCLHHGQDMLTMFLPGRKEGLSPG